MPTSVIPSSHADLFKKKAFAHLATLMPGGQPQVTPVWVDYDGHHVLINTAQGRQKDKNLQKDKRVALSIIETKPPVVSERASWLIVGISMLSMTNRVSDGLPPRTMKSLRSSSHCQ